MRDIQPAVGMSPLHRKNHSQSYSLVAAKSHWFHGPLLREYAKYFSYPGWKFYFDLDRVLKVFIEAVEYQ